MDLGAFFCRLTAVEADLSSYRGPGLHLNTGGDFVDWRRFPNPRLVSAGAVRLKKKRSLLWIELSRYSFYECVMAATASRNISGPPAEEEAAEPLNMSGGDGTSGGMGPWEQSVELRLGRIEVKLDTLPTRNDLLVMLIATLTIAMAVVAVIVGAMGWLETRAARVQATAVQPAAAPPAPIVIQLPAPPAQSPPSSRKSDAS